MKLTKSTINKLIVAGGLFAMAGALVADLTGNLLPLVVGFVGLYPMYLQPKD